MKPRLRTVKRSPSAYSVQTVRLVMARNAEVKRGRMAKMSHQNIKWCRSIPWRPVSFSILPSDYLFLTKSILTRQKLHSLVSICLLFSVLQGYGTKFSRNTSCTNQSLYSTCHATSLTQALLQNFFFPATFTAIPCHDFTCHVLVGNVTPRNVLCNLSCYEGTKW